MHYSKLFSEEIFGQQLSVFFSYFESTLNAPDAIIVSFG